MYTNVIVCNTHLPMAPQNQSLCGIVFGLRAIYTIDACSLQLKFNDYLL